MPAAAVGLLAAQQALREAWFAVVTFNRAYFDIHDASWYPFGGALQLYVPALPPLYGMFLLAAVAGVLGLVRLWRGRRERAARARRPVGLGVFWLWLLIAFYLACVGPGRLDYHLMPTLPALGLIALYPLDRLAGRRGLGAQIVVRPSAAVAVVACGFILASVAADNVERMARCWREKPHWHALKRCEPTGYESQAAELRRLTEPHETIYVWGWSPGTYRYAYRRCASRFATLEKTGRLGERARFLTDGAIEDIMGKRPAAFVISITDLPAVMRPPHSPFADWLDRNYENRGEFGGMYILTPRPGIPPPPPASARPGGR